MSRIAFCEACNMMRNGVKSRIALEHTCGLETGAIPEQSPIEKTEDTYFFDVERNIVLKKDKDGNVQDITKKP